MQHLAVRLIGNGYRFFVLGEIPKAKDPAKVDRKLCSRYDFGVSKWVQFRRSMRGEAKVRYLRYGHQFILIATEGRHRFFDEESSAVRDASEVPIRCFGYEIMSRPRGTKFHPVVKLGEARFEELRSQLLNLALATDSALTKRILDERLIFFSGVKRQIFRILKEVNERRRTAGLEPLFVNRSHFANPSVQVF